MCKKMGSRKEKRRRTLISSLRIRKILQKKPQVPKRKSTRSLASPSALIAREEIIPRILLSPDLLSFLAIKLLI